MGAGLAGLVEGTQANTLGEFAAGLLERGLALHQPAMAWRSMSAQAAPWAASRLAISKALATIRAS
ncbi:hypothetical protein O162_31455 [Pseudomonas putida SJ3]|nr:hypothetical protein O162_31455 [Pseudomonas putida SJ3]